MQRLKAAVVEIQIGGAQLVGRAGSRSWLGICMGGMLAPAVAVFISG